MLGLNQQALTQQLPKTCLPTPDVGFEFEVLTLEILLRGCSHHVYVCYLFDPLLSQGMKIKTSCLKRSVGLRLLVSIRCLRDGLQTPWALCSAVCVIAYSAHTVCTPGALIFELDQVPLASCTVRAQPAFDFADKADLGIARL